MKHECKVYKLVNFEHVLTECIKKVEQDYSIDIKLIKEMEFKQDLRNLLFYNLIEELYKLPRLKLIFYFDKTKKLPVEFNFFKKFILKHFESYEYDKDFDSFYKELKRSQPLQDALMEIYLSSSMKMSNYIRDVEKRFPKMTEERKQQLKVTFLCR